MCFINDNCLGARQKLDESRFLHRKVGQQQVVINHYEVGFLRRTARLDDETFLVQRTLLPQAIVGGGRHDRPDPGILRHLDKLGPVTAARAMPPLTNRDDIVAQRCCNRINLLESLQAKVVGTALKQRGRYGTTQGLTNQRQVTMVQLVLQRLRAGGDDRLFAAKECRDKIGKGLAGAGSCLDDQAFGVVDGFRHGLRHPALSRARLESGQMSLERA